MKPHPAFTRLAAGEVNYRLLAENACDLICHCDADGICIYASPSHAQVLGADASTGIGVHAFNRVHPDDWPALHDEIRRQLLAGNDGGDIPVIELRMRHRDGHYVWLGSKICVLRDPLTGANNGFVAVSRDITAEKLARDERRASEERFFSLADLSADGYWETDADGRLTFLCGGLLRVHGLEPYQMIGRRRDEFALDPDDPGLHAYRQAIAARARFRSVCFASKPKAEGPAAYISLSGEPRYEQGIFIGYRGVGRDVTEVRDTRVELHQANERLRTTLESIGDAFFSVDKEWRLTYVNLKTAQFAGRDRDDMVGNLLAEAVPEILGTSVMARYHEAMRTGERMFFECYYEPAQAWIEVRVYPHDEGLSVYFHDITERKMVADRLEYMATHDLLTGLPNRLPIRRHLQSLLDADPADDTIAVMFVDLDGFKRINDSMGHVAGDAVLRAAAQRLFQALGPADMIARFGGDQFIVVAQCPGGRAEAADAAQELLSALDGAFDVEGQHVFISASVGIAMLSDKVRAKETLYQNANTALYRAKAAGRGQCRFFEAGMAAEAKQRMALEVALRHALERGELDVHYQPQVDLHTGRVVGLEALLRWRHPVWGDVSPARFIPVAEETGMIVTIGSWVLRTACKQVADWRTAGMGDMRIAVNLSARQFAQADLVETVAMALDESGLPADLLDLELTESMVMNDLDRTVDVLARLKDLGLALSIDDFGTGYSSLAYLKRFPIDILKIDRSFVHEISHDSQDAAIADAIIAMAHRLGIRVIAEGVETEAQCEVLSGRMCDEIQGYLFSPALPADSVEQLIRSGKTLPAHLLARTCRAMHPA